VAQGVPLVSYVLVNWHTEELLPRALESIAAQSYGLPEIIVVDNGSPDFDPALLAGCEARLIRNHRNLGFAAANNQGIRECTGDFVVLLNCDACLDSGFVEAALRPMLANLEIGTVVPKILRDDGSGVIDSAGHLMHRDRTPAHRGRGERDQGQYDRGGFVFGGSAAAVVYRREMLEQVAWGGQVFDEAFFAYFEDVDLDWRVQLAGWRAYYEPRAVAQHRGHGSGGRASWLIRLRAEKNRYLMLAKCDTLGCQLADLGPLALYEGWHLLITLLRPWLWPAYLLLLAGLPRAWCWRGQLGWRRRVQPREVARWFVARGSQPPPRAEPPAPERGLLETDAEAAVREEMLAADARHGADELFPLVSAVVLTCNGLELTKRCLKALEAQSYPELEVIVVDNGSEVDEAELLAITHPSVRVLRLERNQGFSGGVNWGASLARGDYIALINNDAQPERDCIRNLVYSARRHGAAAVSGRLVDVRDEETLRSARAALDAELDVGEEYVGGLPPATLEALAESHRHHGVSLFGYQVSDAYEQPGCFYPSGGLCLIERRAAERWLPELLPQRYFAYHEDVCLGLRLRGRDERIIKEPRAAAVHLASSTARRLGRVRLRFLQECNRCLNMLGFYPAGVLWKLTPLYLLIDLYHVVALLALSPPDLLGWLGARLWVLTHPAEIARWRAGCRSGRMVPDAKWLGELSGQLRGSGGWLNELTLSWCRLTGIPHREQRS